jgi:hypothetical protein
VILRRGKRVLRIFWIKGGNNLVILLAMPKGIAIVMQSNSATYHKVKYGEQ